MNNYESLASAFYLAYFGRPAEPEGLAFWSAHLQRSNGDLTEITAAFANSEEAGTRFGDKTTAEHIADVYLQLFNREPDAAGLQFWTDAIDKGRTTLAEVSLNILQGAQGSDIAISAKRQGAADEFTRLVTRLDIDFRGDAAVKASHAMLMSIQASTDPALVSQLVQRLAPMVDAVHDNPAVLDAILLNVDVDALFLSTRGRAEPENLFLTLSDVALAAAGNPATLDALLRGGGMGKVLEVMPKLVSLNDVVGALANGGLDAAVELIYPSPITIPTPTPIPTPTLDIDFSAGTLKLTGTAVYPAVVDLGKKLVSFNGQDVAVGGKIEKVIATGYAGKITLSGTVEELRVVTPQSPGLDYQIVDSKHAVLVDVAGVTVLAPSVQELLLSAKLVKFSEPVSAQEYAVLKAVPGFDISVLKSGVDLVAPAPGTLAFEGLAFADADGKIAFTNHDSISFKTIDTEAGARVSFQKFDTALSAWLDLPVASVKGLEEGEHQFRSVVKDVAGNVSYAKATLTVDQSAPVVSKLQFAPNDGIIGAGESIDVTVTFDGPVNAGEGASINFSNHGSALYKSGNGSSSLVFSYTPAAGQDTAQLALDLLSPVSGAILDRAGNALTASGIAAAALEAAPEVDVTAPTQTFTFATIMQSTGIGASVANGNAPLQTNLEVARVYALMNGYLGDGEQVVYSIDGGDNWSDQGVLVVENSVSIANVAALGNPTIMLSVVDRAGNYGTASSRAIVYDNVAPQVGSLVFAAVTEGAQDTINGDNVTDLAVVSVTFQHSGAWLAEGDRLEYTTNGLNWTSLGLQSNPETGVVTIAGLHLDEGKVSAPGVRTTTVAVRAIDAAGNPSNLISQDLMYKQIGPAPALALYRDSGIDGDGITNVGELTVSNLSKDLGATWEYSIDNGASWTPGYGIDQNGRSSFSATQDGAYTALVRQTVNGVLSAQGKLAFTLDTEASVLAHAQTNINGNVGQAIFSYVGKVEAGDKLEYRINTGNWLSGDKITLDTLMHQVIVDGVALAASDPKVEVRVTDLAGNVSNIAEVTIDGPYVKPSLTTTASIDGVLATGSVGGKLYIVPEPTVGYGVVYAGNYNAIPAGVPSLIGAQPMTRPGQLALRIDNKFVYDESGRVFLLGSHNADTLDYQGSANASAWGFYGNDTIRTGDGNDIVYSGYDTSTITAGKGADSIDISRGMNTLVFGNGDSSVANGIDVVTFAAELSGNTAAQRFKFAEMPAFGDYVDGVAAPLDGSGSALLAALNAAQPDLGDWAMAAVVVAFENRDTYLVVDTGDGIVDQNDYIIKLVGAVPEMNVMNGEVVFGAML